MNNHNFWRNLVIIGLFFIILGSSLTYLNLSHYVNAPNINSQTTNIIIPYGYSVKRIGKELAARNLITYPKVFLLVHRLFFDHVPLRAGEYEIPAHASVHDIIKILYEGRVIVHKITFPEGITTKEIIDKILNEPTLLGNITKEFDEGVFLSDTYYYTYGETKMTLIRRIIYESLTLLNELWDKRAANLPLANKEEALILASIIEKETGIASERPRIAGVFINRLRKKMKLQADPTVIYAVTQGKYLLTRSLSRNDLKIDSPYNTYLYPGLPPTPIANSGKAAIEAALHPLTTNELFFVVDGKGGHNFSSSLAEHNQHVSNYRNGVNNVK